MVVKAVLKKLGVPYTCVELGRVEIQGSLTEIKQEQLKSALLKLGFELMEDRKSVLIEKIKNIIIAMIHSEDELPKTKFSCYLSKELDHNYTYLSNLFSKVKGTTIEHFILSHKIERVKELLIYNELTLSEIAWKLNYSSVAHLSNQFKKITGSTPSHFKNRKRSGLIALENLMNYAE
jgi:AraC-like DNA-binding protein